MGAGRPKGSSGTNKSAAIRDYLQNNPNATTSEVVDALGQKGVDVSQALVAGVRARASGSTPVKRKASVPAGEITTKELNGIHSIVEKFEDADIVMGLIEDCCGLIEQFGSIERLQDGLKAYANWKPEEGSVAVEENSEISNEDSSESDDDEEDSADDEDEDEDEDD